MCVFFFKSNFRTFLKMRRAVVFKNGNGRPSYLGQRLAGQTCRLCHWSLGRGWAPRNKKTHISKRDVRVRSPTRTRYDEIHRRQRTRQPITNVWHHDQLPTDSDKTDSAQGCTAFGNERASCENSSNTSLSLHRFPHLAEKIGKKWRRAQRINTLQNIAP